MYGSVAGHSQHHKASAAHHGKMAKMHSAIAAEHQKMMAHHQKMAGSEAEPDGDEGMDDVASEGAPPDTVMNSRPGGIGFGRGSK